MKALVAFACTAIVSAALQLSLSSCADNNCGCAPTPMFPAQRSPLPIAEADNFSAAGSTDPLPFDLTGGTMEIAGQQLVIRYEVDGDARETVYDIVPAAPSEMR